MTFRRQRLRNCRTTALPQKIESPHVLDVLDGKPPTKLLRKPCRKLFDHFRAVGGAFCAFLLVLDDAAADFEVRHHLKRVHDRGHAPTGGLDEVANLGDERGQFTGRGFHDHSALSGGGFLFHRADAG